MKRNLIICVAVIFLNIAAYSQTLVKGLYVDKFNQILGNVQKEDSLLNYAQSQGFNYLALYNLWNIHTSASLTNTTTALPLANFINKAKTMFGITSVGATGESYWFFSNVIHIYNQQHSNPNHKFNVYNLEFEFWINSSVNTSGIYCTTYLQPQGFTCDTSGAFKFFKRELRRIDSLGNTIGVTSETYIGWPNAGQAKAIVQNCDRVLVSAYVNNQTTTYSYTRPRLMDLSGASVQAKVIPIFSAEPSFMGPWVQTNSPLQAFTNYSVNFSNETGSWKSNVALLGYQWFAYSFMPKTFSLGMDEIQSTSAVSVYPNPVINGKIRVECNPCEVYISNCVGQIVQTNTTTLGTLTEIDVSNLNNGIYFISINNSYKKIVINNH